MPLFYDRGPDGTPAGWIEVMKRAISCGGARFTARRMVQEYSRDYYVPALEGDPEGDDPPIR